MRCVTIVALILGCTAVSFGQEMRSVLITPRLNSDVQRVQTEQVQTPQPQVIYVQPQQQPQRSSQWEDYMRMRMWFSMNYEKRGILFPRYVRRSQADTMQRYLYYKMLMNR